MNIGLDPPLPPRSLADGLARVGKKAADEGELLGADLTLAGEALLVAGGHVGVKVLLAGAPVENLEKSGDKRGEGSGVGSARTLGFEESGGGGAESSEDARGTPPAAPAGATSSDRGGGTRVLDANRVEKFSPARAPTADASRHAPARSTKP